MSLHLNGTWQCNVIMSSSELFSKHVIQLRFDNIIHSTKPECCRIVICHQFAFVTMEPSQQDNWRRKSALFFSNFLNSLDAAEVSIIKEKNQWQSWMDSRKPAMPNLKICVFVSYSSQNKIRCQKHTYGSTVNVPEGLLNKISNSEASSYGEICIIL